MSDINNQKGRLNHKGKAYLIFASLTTVSAFDIHDQGAHVLALTDPDPLGRLHPCRLVHHVKVGPKQPIQESAYVTIGIIFCLYLSPISDLLQCACMRVCVAYV